MTSPRLLEFKRLPYPHYGEERRADHDRVAYLIWAETNQYDLPIKFGLSIEFPSDIPAPAEWTDRLGPVNIILWLHDREACADLANEIALVVAKQTHPQEGSKQ